MKKFFFLVEIKNYEAGLMIDGNTKWKCVLMPYYDGHWCCIHVITLIMFEIALGLVDKVWMNGWELFE